MKLFDSHCHLNDKAYRKDREAVIGRAREAGVKNMMVVGITEDTCRQAVDIASAFEGCFASVGIHPHDASRCSAKTLDNLKTLAARSEVKAWGETGLDFNRMFSPQKDQETCFSEQVEIAGSLDLPLIFHERDSEGRFYELLCRHMAKNQKGVVHCFSGNRKEMESYLELGLFIGVTGIVTLRKRAAKLRRLVEILPEEYILVETDAPYLIPEPERRHTKRNEPAFVRFVLSEVAAIRQTDPERLAAVVWDNTCRLFSINRKQTIQPDATSIQERLHL